MKAFTLVELLIVISILCILASLILPAVMRARDAASANSGQVSVILEKGQVNTDTITSVHPYGLEKLFSVEDINVYKFVISNRIVLITMNDRANTAASMLELKE